MPLLQNLICIVALAAVLAPSLFSQGDVISMPDPAVLSERVMASLKKLAPRRDAFLYLEEETERKLDRHGLSKTTTTQNYEVTMVMGGRVSRLVMEDGKPLSEERAKAEETRIQAQIKAQEAP